MMPTTMVAQSTERAHLAPLLVDAIRQLAEMRRERDVWRDLAEQAIHTLHDRHVEHQRQTERYHAVLAQRRAERQRAA